MKKVMAPDSGDANSMSTPGPRRVPTVWCWCTSHRLALLEQARHRRPAPPIAAIFGRTFLISVKNGSTFVSEPPNALAISMMRDRAERGLEARQAEARHEGLLEQIRPGARRRQLLRVVADADDLRVTVVPLSSTRPAGSLPALPSLVAIERLEQPVIDAGDAGPGSSTKTVEGRRAPRRLGFGDLIDREERLHLEIDVVRLLSAGATMPR